MAALLDVSHIRIAFGGVTALDDVSLTIEPGRIAGVIGPNGSGKTTLFNCICGYYRPSGGRILLEGRDITRLAPHHVARYGIGRTFQSAHLFADLSLYENLALAAQTMQVGGSLARGLLATAEKPSDSLAQDLLARLGLEAYAEMSPSEIPVGLAKLGDLGRALATRPKLLLLDEPAVGLNDSERRRLSAVLQELSQNERLTILIVDHNVGFITALCETITVLASGRVLSSGTPEEVRRDPDVIQAYLGDDFVVVP